MKWWSRTCWIHWRYCPGCEAPPCWTSVVARVFPGMPLAVARPDLEVTLLDSRRKRVEFLRHVCTATGRADVRTVHSRVEDYRARQKI